MWIWSVGLIKSFSFKGCVWPWNKKIKCTSPGFIPYVSHFTPYPFILESWGYFSLSRWQQPIKKIVCPSVHQYWVAAAWLWIFETDNENTMIRYRCLQSEVSCFDDCNNNSHNTIKHTNRDNNIHRLRQGMTFVVYMNGAGCRVAHKHIYGPKLTSWEYLKNVIGIWIG